ncbi:ATP-dependent zinc metalloprotease FtsH 2 [Moritella viscosa]|nr:ATP-dependent zinc metalloprotease FtsH 2 [Moritella viscosa]
MKSPWQLTLQETARYSASDLLDLLNEAAARQSKQASVHTNQ